MIPLSSHICGVSLAVVSVLLLIADLGQATMQDDELYMRDSKRK